MVEVLTATLYIVLGLLLCRRSDKADNLSFPILSCTMNQMIEFSLIKGGNFHAADANHVTANTILREIFTFS